MVQKRPNYLKHNYSLQKGGRKTAGINKTKTVNEDNPFKSLTMETSKYQRTPPESVFTSNNKYITNQESKEKQHVAIGIRTRASGILGQCSNIDI